MARYAAALTTAGPDMFKNKGEVRFKAAEGGDTAMALSKAQEAEARWEFSLAASNLPAAIAPDIRKFLRLVSWTSARRGPGHKPQGPTLSRLPRSSFNP